MDFHFFFGTGFFEVLELTFGPVVFVVPFFFDVGMLLFLTVDDLTTVLGFWLSALPAADFDAALVRPSRRTWDADFAADVDVCLFGALR